MPESSADLKKKLEVPILLVLWYASSVVCTNTSKTLKKEWNFMEVTFVQCLLGAMVGAFLQTVFRSSFPYKKITDRTEVKMLALLSVFFVLGFSTLNSSLANMDVSLVMTLRALEPLFTVVLSVFFLKSEVVTSKIVMGLMPVVLGAGMSAAASTSFTFPGLMSLFVCNCCFALRSIISKAIKTTYKPDDFSLFYHICAIGAAIQLVLLVLLHATGQITVDPNASRSISFTLVINGITFWMYLQLSWLVLSRVPAVTHSVFNAMRRPVICAFGIVAFGESSSLLNIGGIALASGGMVVYGRISKAEKERVSRAKKQ